MKEIPAWKFWLFVIAMIGTVVFGLYLMSEVMGHPSDDPDYLINEIIKESNLRKQ